MRISFGQMMGVLRVDRGWSHAEMARRTSLSRQTVRRIETLDHPDQMQQQTLLCIANNAYGRKPSELVEMWRILNVSAQH